MRVSETVSKKRGRPVAFSDEYLDDLASYHRRVSGRDMTRRSLQDKAYFLRCMRVLFGDGKQIPQQLEDCPLLRYLADPATGKCRTMVMAKLGRIEDEGEMIETALGVCFFEAGKDFDPDEIRKAWQVIKKYAEAKA